LLYKVSPAALAEFSAAKENDKKQVPSAAGTQHT